MDEASGDAIDSSGNGRNLTDTNTVGSGTGKVAATARDFELTNAEYFTRADEAAFEVGTQSYTACGWINLESTPASTRIIMSKYDISANLGWRLYTDAGNNFAVRMKDAVEINTVTHSTVLSNGTWYFVAGGWDAAQTKAWASINAGTREHGSAGTMNLADATYSFRIGREVNGSAGTYWDGLLEQWGLWIGRLLTDAELAYIYNAGVGRILF